MSRTAAERRDRNRQVRVGVDSTSTPWMSCGSDRRPAAASASWLDAGTAGRRGRGLALGDRRDRDAAVAIESRPNAWSASSRRSAATVSSGSSTTARVWIDCATSRTRPSSRRMVARLRADGWEVATEVSFNVFGERGSIDILAFHPTTGALLVIEVKTVVPDVRRHARRRSIGRSGWPPGSRRDRGWRVDTCRRDCWSCRTTSTARRRVDRPRGDVRGTRFPSRNVEVNRWLRAPSGPLAGLLFLSDGHRGGRSSPRRRQTARRLNVGHYAPSVDASDDR